MKPNLPEHWAGSSPLMRGKVAISGNFRVSVRIIPAHAGKRRPWKPLRTRTWDHPRSCGEKGLTFLGVRNPPGSSPLMRGKVHNTLSIPVTAGIIPAHAGKSTIELAPGAIVEDHPRSCGEKLVLLPQALHCQGSSPLMRGKVSAVFSSFSDVRIIPAHAGKRRPGLSRAAVGRDHPRSCGEKHRRISTCVMLWGSSPLMRGKEYM